MDRVYLFSLGLIFFKNPIMFFHYKHGPLEYWLKYCITEHFYMQSFVRVFFDCFVQALSPAKPIEFELQVKNNVCLRNGTFVR